MRATLDSASVRKIGSVSVAGAGRTCGVEPKIVRMPAVPFPATVVGCARMREPSARRTPVSVLPQRVAQALAEPERMAPIRERARQDMVERYDLRGRCLGRHVALAEHLARGEVPPPAEG